MIGTIRKHSTWLWGVIIVVVIVTFVFWGSQSGYDRSGNANFGFIDGQPISRDDFVNAQREVYLRYFLSHGTWPDSDTRQTGFNPQRETYEWLFLISKLHEYNIHTDSASVAQVARERLNILEQNHIPTDTFLQQHADDLQRYVRHELGVRQLMSVVGLSGQLVTPDEARALYEHEFQELATEAVFFSASNYLASVPAPTSEAVTQYYELHQADYRVPERVQVSYVAFNITNRLEQAEKQLTNLDELVDANVREIGTNYYRIAKTPEEARARIREELIRRQAILDARREADEFAGTLFDMNPVQASNLALLAKTNDLTVKATAPFDEENGPKEFDGGPNFAKAAFLLTTNEPFADQPLIGDGAVYMIALDKRIPSEIPPLDRIRERVLQDYRHSQAVLLARNAGSHFVEVATNSLAQGKTFAAICVQADARPVTVPPFSLSTRELPAVEDHASLEHFQQVAFSTLPGHVSRFSLTPAGGLAVYVERRLPIDEAKMKEQMPRFIELVRRAREQEALAAWFNREANRALRGTPFNQPQPSPLGGPNPS
jgi:hypothetical protein